MSCIAREYQWYVWLLVICIHITVKVLIAVWREQSSGVFCSIWWHCGDSDSMLGEWQETRLWHCTVCISYQCCNCPETVECNCFVRYMYSYIFGICGISATIEHTIISHIKFENNCKFEHCWPTFRLNLHFIISEDWFSVTLKSGQFQIKLTCRLVYSGVLKFCELVLNSGVRWTGALYYSSFLNVRKIRWEMVFVVSI